MHLTQLDQELQCCILGFATLELQKEEARALLLRLRTTSRELRELVAIFLDGNVSLLFFQPDRNQDRSAGRLLLSSFVNRKTVTVVLLAGDLTSRTDFSREGTRHLPRFQSVVEAVDTMQLLPKLSAASLANWWSFEEVRQLEKALPRVHLRLCSTDARAAERRSVVACCVGTSVHVVLPHLSAVVCGVADSDPNTCSLKTISVWPDVSPIPCCCAQAMALELRARRRWARHL
jgi:hypothetical protein